MLAIYIIIIPVIHSIEYRPHCSVVLTTREATWYIISAVSVCRVSVSMYDDNFRKLSRKKFIFAHPGYLLRGSWE